MSHFSRKKITLSLKPNMSPSKTTSTNKPTKMSLPTTPPSIPPATLFFLILTLLTPPPQTLHAISTTPPFPHNPPTQVQEPNQVLIRGNKPIIILSENQTFKLGFFNFNNNNNLKEPHWYLAIRHASVSPPIYVWVANREKPIKDLTEPNLEITEKGQLALKNSSKSVLWNSTNPEGSSSKKMKLLENGNLVLLTHEGFVSWQSFDHPTDSWLPGMNLTLVRSLVSWTSETDPSPGLYSLRLRPQEYGEFELVFNGTESYWSTEKWTGDSFVNVPEMRNLYIYRFRFMDPFSPAASFGFSEKTMENGLRPPTLLRVEAYGQVRQYTWWQQTGSWNMFWSRPEDVCEVFGVCGRFGVCIGGDVPLRFCQCVSGFRPLDGDGWSSGVFSGGCWSESDGVCGGNDGFEDVGVVRFDGGYVHSFGCSSRKVCESVCLGSCSCVGMCFHEGSGLCKNFYGSLLNFRNFSSLRDKDDGDGDGDGDGDVLFVRVSGRGSVKKGLDHRVLTDAIVGCVAVLVGVMAVIVLVLIKRRQKGLEEDGFVSVLNLQFFSYKELQLATRGFSEKLGHGGFGTVFQGELTDSTVVAVKRLERPGGGEKEFREEVCTIGNIQHVNLVRLRGFCSENCHRLLVYEYMSNGSLSAYLRKEGPSLGWDVRLRVTIGTAKGIAYLHEECRDCIIHCDIKPENILLDSNFTAKVSDFGLAKLIGRDFSRVLTTMRGTWGYVAPEWISGVAITTKADVYSYGMTLLELIGGRRNVEAPPSAGARESGCETGEKWFFPPWAAQQIIEGNVTAVVDKKLENVYNIEEARRVTLVAIWCIQDDEAMRPTMGMVVKMLEGLMEVSIPPPLKLLQALVIGESFHGVKVDFGNGVSTGGSLEFSTADSESHIRGVFSPSDVNANV